MIKKQKYSFDFVLGTCMPVIDLVIESIDVEVGVRPLQVTWTPELAQDVAAFHNIDAEQELTNLLSQQIAAEIDREILNDLMNLVEPFRPNRNILTPSEVNERNLRLQRERNIREETINKWSSLGFLDGLQGHLREDITTLYEGQARTLINEETAPGPGGFDTIQFPTARRVYPRLVANDIIAVQPLNVPPPMEFNTFTPTLMEEQEEYDVNWRTVDTWTYDNMYGSIIGISMELKPHEFIPKKHVSAFESVWLPRVNRVFT